MYRHILFDLDGTLTDPSSGITRSVQYALAKFGIDSELSEHRRFIGPPLYDSFAEFYGFTREQSVEAVKFYRELYNDGGAMYDNRVYGGVPELLAELRSRGCELILATSKPLPTAKLILERFKLADYFDFTFGCEFDGTRTKKDEVIAYALEQHSIDLTSAVMVGDRLHDIEGAHKNGLPAIGVLWGFGDRQELESHNADMIAGSIDELRKYLI